MRVRCTLGGVRPGRLAARPPVNDEPGEAWPVSPPFCLRSPLSVWRLRVLPRDASSPVFGPCQDARRCTSPATPRHTTPIPDSARTCAAPLRPYPTRPAHHAARLPGGRGRRQQHRGAAPCAFMHVRSAEAPGREGRWKARAPSQPPLGQDTPSGGRLRAVRGCTAPGPSTTPHPLRTPQHNAPYAAILSHKARCQTRSKAPPHRPAWSTPVAAAQRPRASPHRPRHTPAAPLRGARPGLGACPGVDVPARASRRPGARRMRLRPAAAGRAAVLRFRGRRQQGRCRGPTNLPHLLSRRRRWVPPALRGRRAGAGPCPRPRPPSAAGVVRRPRSPRMAPAALPRPKL
ncbi:MAG: hypothetical protein J3K34DRAFT_439690 [Monoraphidium minutum]|nr:MAG: hypothetical protein J3K34DRAFT_439690 [Monoraphidium minutum]